MPRYKIIGTPWASSGFGTAIPRYVDADSPEAARRTVKSDWEFIEEIREVPIDEGRSWLWLLIKRLWG